MFLNECLECTRLKFSRENCPKKRVLALFVQVRPAPSTKRITLKGTPFAGLLSNPGGGPKTMFFALFVQVRPAPPTERISFEDNY